MFILQLIILLFLLCMIVVLLGILFISIYFAFRGAPYAVTDEKTLKGIIEAATQKKKGRALDVGSGDGRIVIALAQAGFEAHGYEFNPLLVWWSRRNIRKAGLAGKAFIHMRDFWREDFSVYDVVVMYQITYIMRRLEQKLQREMKPGSVVICNHFTLPSYKPSLKKGRVNHYRF